jgi:hypothetical protein
MDKFCKLNITFAVEVPLKRGFYLKNIPKLYTFKEIKAENGSKAMDSFSFGRIFRQQLNVTVLLYRVGHKSLSTHCKSQSMRNRWITIIYDLIRPRGKSLGGVTLTAAIL